jgi:hypothetical protein
MVFKKKCIAFFLLIAALIGSCQPDNMLNLQDLSNETTTLIVEEYEIVSNKIDQPDHVEFRERVPPEAFSTRLTFHYPPPDVICDQLNPDLVSYGYELHQHPYLSSYDYQLFNKSKLVLDHIASFSPITRNQDGKKFILTLTDKSEKTYLLQNDGLSTFQQTYSMELGPIWAADQLVQAYFTGSEVEVVSGESLLFSLPTEASVDVPLKGFWGWQGHWVLEVNGKLYIDGNNFNNEKKLNEIFHWRLLQEQPFYFFKERKGGNPYGIHFAGQDLNDYRYEEIVHNQCCEPAIFNPGDSPFMVWFYGLRNGTWYYVEAGVYGEK